MSEDTTKTEAPKAETKESAPRTRKRAESSKAPFKATLKRGRLYVYGGQKFEKGKAVGVSEETADYLRENAVDHITVEGESEARPKFLIEKNAE